MSMEQAAQELSNGRGRVRVGVVVGGVEDDYEMSVLRGVLQAATDRGVQIVTFASSENGSTVLSEQLFSLVSPASVAGVIVLSGALVHHVGTALLERLFATIGDLPACGVGLKVGKEPTVLVDNEAGMRELLDYLIETRGYRRLAFIQGPPTNAEAVHRFETYRQTLARHGLAFDENLVVPGDFLRRSGEAAVQTLFGERGLSHRNLDAIVAADDIMAQGALQALVRRDVRVPKDLAIVGFDDVAAGRRCDPPLTTVRQPLEELGVAALDLVLKQLAGEPVSDIRFPTRLIVRRSCGATPDKSEPATPSTGNLRDHQGLLTARLEAMTQGRLSPLGEGWAERLVEALVRQLEGRAPEAFRGKYEEYLHVLAPLDVDLEVFHDVLSTLRETVSALSAEGSPQSIAADALFLDLSQRTGMAVERAIVRRRVRAEQATFDLRVASAAIVGSFALERLAQTLQENLPRLGVQRLYLARRSGRFDAQGKELAQLLLAYDDHADRSSIAPSSPRSARGPEVGPSSAPTSIRLPEAAFFPMGDLVPRGLIPNDSRAYVVKPLGFEERPLGFILVSMGAWEPYTYEALREGLSAFLRGNALHAKAKALDALLNEPEPTTLEAALTQLEQTRLRVGGLGA